MNKKLLKLFEKLEKVNKIKKIMNGTTKRMILSKFKNWQIFVYLINVVNFMIHNKI